MKRYITIISALTRSESLEMIRRKDYYVLVVVLCVMIACASGFRVFGVTGLEVFVRDVTFAGMGIFTTVLTIFIACRQVPKEIDRKTIYPMIARPITRYQFLIGKWFAASVTSSIGFLFLCISSVIMLYILGVPVPQITWQYTLLKIVGIFWLSAFCIFISLYVTLPAAIVISLLVAFGSSPINSALLMFYESMSPFNPLLAVLYAIMPHYDFFDLSGKVVHEWPPISLSIIAFLLAYSILSGLFWVSIGWIKFRNCVI